METYTCNNDYYYNFLQIFFIVGYVAYEKYYNEEFSNNSVFISNEPVTPPSNKPVRKPSAKIENQSNLEIITEDMESMESESKEISEMLDEINEYMNKDELFIK